MDAKTKSLIAAGAAAAVNFRPCREHLVPKCVKAGASEDEILDAIDTGFQVNRGAHAKTQAFADEVLTNAQQSIDEPTPECCDEATAARTGCC